MANQRVAILGLGIMGSGMAGRLLSASFALSVYNRNRDKAAPFAQRGAFVANSPREAASRAEIVISMVADDAASRAVWLGGQGALAGIAPGSVLMECSTLSVGWIRELAAAAEKRGCELLDAPVTGTKPHAANGELRFLVGGPVTALEKAKPALAVMGQEAVHLGANGSGALMKLINNFLCGAQAASFAEASALIDASGLDREKALGILTGGAPASPLIKAIVGRVAARSLDDPNFVLRLMAKDLTYAAEEGARHGVTLQTAAPALAVFKNAIAGGLGEKDFSAVIESLRKRSGARPG